MGLRCGNDRQKSQRQLPVGAGSPTMLIMPRKIKQLIKELEKAGFVNRGGKGNHRNFIHPKGVAMTISGNLGDDAKRYQVKEVGIKIKRSKR